MKTDDSEREARLARMKARREAQANLPNPRHWTLEEARELINHLEQHLRPHYFCGLTGSVLYAGESNHDVDVLVMPMQSQHFDRGEIAECLKKAELSQAVQREQVIKVWRERGILDEKWVEVWYYGKKRVDIMLMQ